MVVVIVPAGAALQPLVHPAVVQPLLQLVVMMLLLQLLQPVVAAQQRLTGAQQRCR